MLVSTAVAADTTVVANTKDWQSMYLISVYADSIGADFMFIQSLSDAELKTSLLGDDDVIVFESSTTPVIKNYLSFLSINGFSSVGEYRFLDAYDLQEYLYDQVEPDGIVLLGTDFGMEAIAVVPYALEKNYFPIFYTEDNFRFLFRESRRVDVVALGRVPIRVAEQLRPEQIIIGDPKETTNTITQLTVDELDSQWGVITRIDEIDYESVRADLPVFVYFGEDYLTDTAGIIRNSGISNFEVIGGNTAEIAQELEAQSQRDLNLLLKFGRKITNFDGLEDSLLNVDTLELPFPFEFITLEAIEYHENMGLLTVTYKNEGNVETNVFSNVEYASIVLSDERAHPILPGDTKTIAYDFSNADATELSEPAVITTRYGFSFPLQNVITNDNGLPFVQLDVTQSTVNEEPPALEFRSAIFEEEGILRFRYANTGNEAITFFTEMDFEDRILSSEQDTVQPGETATVSINFLYIPDSRVIDLPFNVSTHFGVGDTYFSEQYEISVQQPTNYTSLAIGLGAVLVAILIFTLFRAKEKGSRHVPLARSASVTRSTKKSAKKSSRKTTKKSAKKTSHRTTRR
jgi:hypothetical protein